MVDMQFSSMVRNLRRSEIRELLKLTRKPDIISFAGGLPDPAIFPFDEIQQSAEYAIKERGNEAFQYSPTEGDPFLKEQLACFMQKQGEKVKPDDIIVVSSSQQGIDLIGKIFIDPGDPVIVEMPSYIGTLQSFRAYNADFYGLKMDYDGVIPESLEENIKLLAKKSKKPKFVYIIPEFQNPSGITTSLERRKRILEIASEHDLIIVEDSPYRELRFKGEMIPSLFSMDTENRVVYLKTFSKILFAGFRLGWALGPAEIIDKMVMTKQGTDLCTSAFVQIVAAYFIQNGFLDKQIEKGKKAYKAKAEAAFNALEKYMPELEGLSWSKPEGSMFMWVKLPEYMDAVDLFQKAIEKKVAYVIGSAFHFDGSGRNTFRLSYSYPTVDRIDEGIKRLAQLVKDETK